VLGTQNKWLFTQADMLSAHISLWDLCHTPAGGNLEDKNFLWGNNYRYNLASLCEDLLEPIIDFYGRPLVVLKGMSWVERSIDKKNKEVIYKGLDIWGLRDRQLREYDGSSLHTTGSAANFLVPGVPARDVWEYCRKIHLFYGELSYCFNKELGMDYVHIALPSYHRGLTYGQVRDTSIDKRGRVRTKLLEETTPPLVGSGNTAAYLLPSGVFRFAEGK